MVCATSSGNARRCWDCQVRVVMLASPPNCPKDNRRFVEAVLYRLRTGIPWRDLPACFGNWHRVYVRFQRWNKQDVWHKVFEQLAKKPNNEYAMIDSTIVRAHRSAAGARKKGHRPVIPKNGSVLAGAGAD